MENKRKAFVLGMAKSGYEAAKLLSGKGYDVIVNDSNKEQNPEHITELQSMGVKLALGSHPEEIFDNTLELLSQNHGISNSHM